MFNRHIPIKKKYIRANEGPFMLKELLKVINEETRLRNIFHKHQTNTNKKLQLPKKSL